MLQRFVANRLVSASPAAGVLPMVAMRSTRFSSGDLVHEIQNSFALLGCVWDQVVSICIRNDPVRWTRPEFVFDQNAVRHELHEIGNARAGLRVGSRFDFNGHETASRLDEIVWRSDQSVSPRNEGASQRPPAIRVL